jgi:hypothetical protein
MVWPIKLKIRAACNPEVWIQILTEFSQNTASTIRVIINPLILIQIHSQKNHKIFNFFFHLATLKEQAMVLILLEGISIVSMSLRRPCSI